GPGASYAISIQSLAFSPDGKSLASGGFDKKFRLWDVTKRREIFAQRTGDIFAVASGIGPNGKILAAAATRGEIHVWNVTERKLIGTLKQEAYANTLAFCPSGRFLATGDGVNIRLWNLRTFEEITTLEGCQFDVNSITFGRDGKRLIAGSLAGVIRVWDTSRLGRN
ncbi:MAG: serine/threonine protein kinase, partial [Candidatus Poribacteria bacterium]|nr:serine/threonine protein kinase [Candidatus Poribacteria bacterium]